MFSISLVLRECIFLENYILDTHRMYNKVALHLETAFRALLYVESRLTASVNGYW